MLVNALRCYSGISTAGHGDAIVAARRPNEHRAVAELTRMLPDRRWTEVVFRWRLVTVAAALYFVWLAWRIATAPPLSADGDKRQSPSFLGGFGLSLVNPKGYAAMAALFSGFVLLRGQLALDAGVKIAILTAVIVFVNVLWLLSGALLTRFFRDPRSNRIINIVFAVLLLASVAIAVRAA